MIALRLHYILKAGYTVTLSAARVNTNVVEYGWPVRMEDPGTSANPIVTDTLSTTPLLPQPALSLHLSPAMGLQSRHPSIEPLIYRFTIKASAPSFNSFGALRRETCRNDG